MKIGGFSRMSAKDLPTVQWENCESTLLHFEVGCRRCSNLERIGKNTYVCSERAHMDDSPVIPIKDGRKTDDWNICNGEYYNKDNRRTICIASRKVKNGDK